MIFLSDGFKGVPQRFRDPRHFQGSSGLVSNKGMRDPANAVRIMGIIASRVSKNDLILFDEYHHGFEENSPAAASVSRQVKASILILIVAGLLLCYSRGRRFGAVRNLPGGDARPGFEYVESVGRLYSRAYASDLAADILRDSFRRGLCLKLGLPSDAPATRSTGGWPRTSGKILEPASTACSVIPMKDTSPRTPNYLI